MDMVYFGSIVISIAVGLLVISIPLTIVSILEERRLRRDIAWADIAATAAEMDEADRAKAIAEPFIEKRVKVSVFGDRRRLTAHTAEFLKPETRPMDLPNEHVEPVD